MHHTPKNHAEQFIKGKSNSFTYNSKYSTKIKTSKQQRWADGAGIGYVPTK
jgi:hypothetical protein